MKEIDLKEIDWTRVGNAIRSAGFTVEEVLASFEKARRNMVPGFSDVAPGSVETVSLDELARTLSAQRGHSTILIIEITDEGKRRLVGKTASAFAPNRMLRLPLLVAMIDALSQTLDRYAAVYESYVSGHDLDG